MLSFAASFAVPGGTSRTTAVAASRIACAAQRIYGATPAGADAGIRFVDATDAWGADVPLRGMLAHAVATGDVNGDGWTDMFVGTFADRPVADYAVRGADGPSPDRLLLGGPGGFRDDPAFPGSRGRTSGAAFADLDGDGDLDLVVARNVRDWDRGRRPSEVLRNDGGGRFTPVATLDSPSGARSIGLLDVDGDGRTDLFVTEDRWSGGSSALLHNEGDFRFRDTTAEAGLPTDVVGMGVATADLTGDGAPDLFVAGSNRLFANDGHGRFREVRTSTFRWRTYGTEDDPAGVAASDVDHDGRIDLVVGQHYGSTIDLGKRVPVRLYLNTGDDGSGAPAFRDVTEAAGLVGLSTRAPHVEIADFDADGWPDILASAATDGTTPMVFRNLGVRDGAPRFVATASQRSQRYWPSGAVLDANHDGRLDLVLADFDARRPTLVLQNSSGAGHWLAVEAEPGTRVEVFDDGGDRALVAATVIDGATGFGAGSGPVAWFGMGPVAGPVEVRGTRADGRLFRLERVPVDRVVAVSCRSLLSAASPMRARAPVQTSGSRLRRLAPRTAP